MKMWPEMPKNVPAEPIIVPDVNNNDLIWFTGRSPRLKNTVKIYTDGRVSIADGVGQTFENEDRVQFGLTRDGQKLKIRTAETGYKLHKSKNLNSYRRLLCCIEISHQLQQAGIEFPAVYIMQFNEQENLWEGELQP